MNIDPSQQLEEELNAWQAAGLSASLWWRDDDAVAPGAKLDKLLDITINTGLLLAVIPRHASSALASATAGLDHVHIAQHGYAHINHAPRGQGLGAWELGVHRNESLVLAELDHGRDSLVTLFGEQFLPVIVPPWNRIATELIEPIAHHGYCGVSAFGARTGAHPAPGLIRVNAHCDPIRWKSGARFAGVEKTINQLVMHLQARRTGQADRHEPTGYLTHHIDLDDDGWAFSTELAQLIHTHPAAHWQSPARVFRGTT